MDLGKPRWNGWGGSVMGRRGDRWGRGLEHALESHWTEEVLYPVFVVMARCLWEERYGRCIFADDECPGSHRRVGYRRGVLRNKGGRESLGQG
jgi:hypothetical protein